MGIFFSRILLKYSEVVMKKDARAFKFRFLFMFVTNMLMFFVLDHATGQAGILAEIPTTKGILVV